MKQNLKDILSHLHSEVDQQTLLNYLQGQLTAEQQHDLEKRMMDESFDADALEGLQEFKDKQKISKLVEQLNIDLKKKTARRKKWNAGKQVKIELWILLAIILVLFLVVISFIVIYRMTR